MNLKTLTASALLVVAVAACGSSAGTSAPSSVTASSAPAASAAPAGSAAATNATPVTVKDFALDPKDVSVAGTVSLAVTNAGPTVHNVTIRDASGKVLGATKDLTSGQSETLTADLPAGSYILFCSLPGHESLGIKGTLTVTQ
ncbi:MAG: cupredoxin domain-containing protein [Chloroflexi bacterium]|nr:cupredoxin domain-containing protein [Chloroflexota bacterium]